MAVISGKTVVATAGEPVRLSDAPIAVSALWIQARHDNTGDVYIGGRETRALNDDIGYRLDAGDKFPPDDGPLANVDLSEWYVDADTADDGINWIARV